MAINYVLRHRGNPLKKYRPVELVDHGGLSVSPHHHLLLLQLLRHLQAREEGISLQTSFGQKG